MKILDILTEKEIFINKAEKVRKIKSDTILLAYDMIHTMYANKGVGLAAPQIGHNIQMFVMDTNYSTLGHSKPFIIINPRVKTTSDEIIFLPEGCLSVPEAAILVGRSKTITVTYRDLEWNKREKEFKDFAARVFLHEMDHLQGTLITHYKEKVND